MGVISTPPIPASAMAVSCAVMFSRSTALPGHHQRVHGFADCVIAGQGDVGACCAAAKGAHTQANRRSRSAFIARSLSARCDFYTIALGVAYYTFVVAIPGATRSGIWS